MQRPLFFLTGFPGFLCSETLPRLLQLIPDAAAMLLVQPQFVDQARSKLAALGLQGRANLVVGDLLKPDLGMAPEQRDFLSQVTQIFHYAAIYDLAVKREPAYQVNVKGTQNMIAVAQKCPRLERFHYVSTCYVSGRYDGTFTEKDLELGQTFNNFYEETKYIAEVEVQKARNAGLPAVIYRPGVVVGHSKTGATQKRDGPYYVIDFVKLQPKIALLPKLGHPEKSTLNLVPSDFVVEALCRLSQHPRAVGQVFHLSDPNASTISEIIQLIAQHTGKKIVSIPMPIGLTKTLVVAPGLKQLLKIPAQTLDYFNHPTQYTSTLTQTFLDDFGLKPPAFRTYAELIIKN